MADYFHSVTLVKDQCKGCTTCIKRCPTEAIRVRDGKAYILEERCIDCGECIRICPNHAKVAVTDSLGRLADFKYTIALPAPSFYGQFCRDVWPARVLGSLLAVGFDHAVEVAWGAEAVTAAVRDYLAHGERKRPLISSACPAVVRLMQVRFPALLPHIIPIATPMEVAARAAREEAGDKLGLKPPDIGVFFLTPCPAKVTAIKQPLGATSWVDGALSIATIYGEVLKKMKSAVERPDLQRASGQGFGWGLSGGENAAIGGRYSLMAVDGIHSVIGVLDEVEKGGLATIDYLEAQACVGGCIGGPLVVQNPFLARVRLRRLTEKFSTSERAPTGPSLPRDRKYFLIEEPIKPRKVMLLDEDAGRALSKMALLENTLNDLPGLDCGSCGSPSCRALAEDIVRGMALETDCIFKLRERVRSLAEEMVELAQKLPPAMRKPEQEREEGPRSVTLEKVVELIRGRVVTGTDLPAKQITGSYCSDMLSDAMASAREGQVWFTIQTHPNVVAVASLLNLGAVVITSGREPDPETVAKAEQEKIPILTTKLPTFEAAGRVYACLSPGAGRPDRA